MSWSVAEAGIIAPGHLVSRIDAKAKLIYHIIGRADRANKALFFFGFEYRVVERYSILIETCSERFNKSRLV
jgi:hypothetical protein